MAATRQEIIDYIRQAAVARGINPDIAVRVARSEGLNANPADGWQSNVVKGGRRETSYGPYQLRVGGGLGDAFIRATGLSPKDPETVFQQIDFALDYAAQNGWSSWYGAKNTGISKWAGLDGAQPAGIQAAPAQPQFAAYDPAQTGSLLQALGYAPQTDLSPAFSALNAEAAGQSPEQANPFAVAFQNDPSPAPPSYPSSQAAGYVNASPRGSDELQRLSDSVTALGQRFQSQKQPESIDPVDLFTLTPEFPIGGQPSYASTSIPMFGSAPLGQGGIGADRARSPDLLASAPMLVAGSNTSQQPRSVATSTVTAPPGGDYGEPVFPGSNGPQAQAAVPPSITVHPLTAQPPTLADFDAVVGPKPLDTSNYTQVAHADIPTMDAFLAGQALPKAPATPPPGIQPVEPAPKRAAVMAPVPATRLPAAAPKQPGMLGDLLKNQLARAGLGFALGGPLGALLGGGSALLAQKGGLMGLLGGGNVLPTMAGPQSQSVYTTPSGQRYDTTEGNHGSYMVSGGTIMSPSEYIDAMKNGLV